jgi:tyrosyl-tRNA synthetase
MGKTAAGAVWLDRDMVSPYDYWQHWRDTEDADVERFLKLFTTLPLDEIARLAALKGEEINEAKKVLATEATALIHGDAAAKEAAETARQTFEEGTLADSLPAAYVPRQRLKDGIKIADVLILAGLCRSKSEVRRAIANKAIAVNDKRVTSFDFVIREKDLMEQGAIKVSFGRKRHLLIKPA